MEIKNKNVIIELKNGRKYFGYILDIDNSPKEFSWIFLKDKNGQTQILNNSEIIRIEVNDYGK